MGRDVGWPVASRASDRRRPKPLRTFLRGVVGNWPVPILNPVGWLFAAADFKSESEDFRELNWMHFVSETKKVIDRKIDKTAGKPI